LKIIVSESYNQGKGRVRLSLTVREVKQCSERWEEW